MAFSTGNVYGLVPVAAAARARPTRRTRVGEYAMSCLGRERIFEHFSRTLAIPMALIRLNYATEMRYGVLVDLARRVRDGLPIDLSIGLVQRHLAGGRQRDGPAGVRPRRDARRWIVNVTGPEALRVREVAETFGRLLGRPVEFAGEETPAGPAERRGAGVPPLRDARGSTPTG